MITNNWPTVTKPGKWILRVVFIVFIIATTGFGASVGMAVQKERQAEAGQPRQMQVGMIADPQTGCQYITHGEAIFPRMDKDGHQICVKRDWRNEN